MEKIVQTAGRKALKEFSPEFAHFNLAKEVWQPNEGDLPNEAFAKIFCWTKLHRFHIHRSGWHFQCDICARM